MHLKYFIDMKLNAFENITNTVEKKKNDWNNLNLGLLKSTSALNVMIY